MPAAMENGTKLTDSESATEQEVEHEPEFEPVVILPEVEVSTNEEHEEELIKLRAKLFRFDTSDPQQPEWKERGTGEVKLLRHKENNSIRVVMRRDKTLKICANHFVTPWMELKPSCGSNRAWVWTVLADFADETAKPECLAIRFANPDIATQWKNKFEEGKTILVEKCDLYKTNNSNSSLSESSASDDGKENSIQEEEGEDAKESTSPKKEAQEDATVISKLAALNVSQ